MKRLPSAALASIAWLAGVAIGGLAPGCGGRTGLGLGLGIGGHGGAGGNGSASSSTGTGGCPQGTACGDGGVCVEGTCCSAGAACNTTCCAAGEVCNLQKCEAPSGDCGGPTDCPAGFYCDYALGPPVAVVDGGACGANTPQSGKCLALPPACGPNQMPGDPITCLPQCDYKPATADFAVVQKYAWGGQVTGACATDIVMAPIVVNLDDDNCDGVVNQDDIPEIVFSTFANGVYFKHGTLHAISIVGGQVVEKWSMPNVVQPGGGLAAADLDGDGVPEIVGCMDPTNPEPSDTDCCGAAAFNSGVIAFRADGSTYWTQPDTTQVHCGYDTPVIGDLDQDGFPEVVVGWTVLDGRTGAVKKVLDPQNTVDSWGVKIMGLADLDGDGKLDVTDGQRAYRSDGSLLWDLRPGGPAGPNAVPSGYHGIADFDKDGKPEVLIISPGLVNGVPATDGFAPHTLALVRYDPSSVSGATVLRQGIDINNGVTTVGYCPHDTFEFGGGPPTVADFDGDGIPDVGMAGAVAYSVFSGATLMNAAIPDANVKALWSQPIDDCPSGVMGSSVFDFTGSGKAQVLYSDQAHLWMFDGPTGTDSIPTTCNTTATLWQYPLVADVENNGEASIVVVSAAFYGANPATNECASERTSGIRVFGPASGSWVRTRGIWNEHTYHVTNINDDGTVPKAELPNWTQPGLDNYRQNNPPGDDFAAPDAVVSIHPSCGADYGLLAIVQNIGQAPLPSGVVVGFYMDAPPSGTKLGTGATSLTLNPAESQGLLLTLTDPPAAITSGQTPVYAVVDDGMPAHPWHECRADNDTSAAVSGKCGG